MDLDLRPLVRSDFSEIDKAIVALWAINGEGPGIQVAQIASILEASGAPKINRSRLKLKLEKDRRAVKNGGNFRISPRKLPEVIEVSKKFLIPVRPDDPKSAIDSSIFDHAPGYVKNIVEQINVSYSNACYDCAAVMIRRLTETMIIDAFENRNSLHEVTDANGDIYSMTPLIKKLSSTNVFSISRQTKQAVPHLKDIGDWSAHNRRYRARKSDLDAAARHLRLVASDLLHVAGQDGG